MSCGSNRIRRYLVNVLLVASCVGAIGELHVTDSAVGRNLCMTTTVAGHFALVIIR
jgi:hypothetical protein